MASRRRQPYDSDDSDGDASSGASSPAEKSIFTFDSIKEERARRDEAFLASQTKRVTFTTHGDSDNDDNLGMRARQTADSDEDAEPVRVTRTRVSRFTTHKDETTAALPHPSNDADAVLEREASAAVGIQSAARGFLARRRYDELLENKIISEEEERLKHQAQQVDEGLHLLQRNESARNIEEQRIVQHSRMDSALFNLTYAQQNRQSGGSKVSEDDGDDDGPAVARSAPPTPTSTHYKAVSQRLHSLLAEDATSTKPREDFKIHIHALSRPPILPDGYRSPIVADLAAQPLLPQGMELPSTLLKSLPAAPVKASKRSSGQIAPRLTSAKMRSRARAPGETGPLIVVAGRRVDGPLGSNHGISTSGNVTTVQTYSEEALMAMSVLSLVELRDRLRDLLSEVNDDLAAAVINGDKIACEREDLKRDIAKIEEGGVHVGVVAPSARVAAVSPSVRTEPSPATLQAADQGRETVVPPPCAASPSSVADSHATPRSRTATDDIARSDSKISTQSSTSKPAQTEGQSTPFKLFKFPGLGAKTPAAAPSDEEPQPGHESVTIGRAESVEIKPQESAKKGFSWGFGRK